MGFDLPTSNGFETAPDDVELFDNTRILEKFGMLSYYDPENKTLENATYILTEGVLSPDIDAMFHDYVESVHRHENAIVMSIETGFEDNIFLGVVDQARSKRHNRLAVRLKEELNLEDWDHEKVRQLVSAMSRSLLAPWIETKILKPNAEDIRTIAEGLKAIGNQENSR